MIYDKFSLVYDELMNDVDYEKLCSKMLLLCKKYSHTPKLALDAACGTGEFTKYLLKNGVDVVGVDISPEMLSIARNKLGSDATLLCQSLDKLDLFGTIDTAFCTLDGLNHIVDFDVLKKSIERISLFLEPDGLFIFDVNTLYKHNEILADNIFVEENDDVYLVWQNELQKNNIVDICLDFFVNENEKYKRFQEFFSERAYSFDELNEALKSAGLVVLDTIDFDTFDSINEKTQKIIYITKKVK